MDLAAIMGDFSTIASAHFVPCMQVAQEKILNAKTGHQSVRKVFRFPTLNLTQKENLFYTNVDS
jgi:hypothetical protein